MTESSIIDESLLATTLATASRDYKARIRRSLLPTQLEMTNKEKRQWRAFKNQADLNSRVLYPLNSDNKISYRFIIITFRMRSRTILLSCSLFSLIRAQDTITSTLSPSDCVVPPDQVNSFSACNAMTSTLLSCNSVSTASGKPSFLSCLCQQALLNEIYE